MWPSTIEVRGVLLEGLAQVALTACHRDREGQRALCPAGRTSISWRQRPDPAGRDRLRVQPQVHRGHIRTATGLNFIRLGAWFADTPRRRSRRSPFAHLLAEPRVA
jgi:hypothetical protein